MMEESGSSLAPKKKKTKINFSHVHQEFDHITIYNPRKEKDVPGSKSKSCGQDFLDRNSTNFIGIFHGVVGVACATPGPAKRSSASNGIDVSR